MFRTTSASAIDTAHVPAAPQSLSVCRRAIIVVTFATVRFSETPTKIALRIQRHEIAATRADAQSA
jgi:hypothetical protein